MKPGVRCALTADGLRDYGWLFGPGQRFECAEVGGSAGVFVECGGRGRRWVFALSQVEVAP